jgi:flagellar hook-associated protein 1 FlgK
MSLTQALATAMTGLRASQAGLAIVAGNVANAETPGYVRKTPVQIATAAGGSAVGVRVAAINRELDQYIQRQLRVESSGTSYASLRLQFYDRLQTIYGVPGSESALETVHNSFLSALQGLSTSPESPSARSAVLHAAQVLTQQLNGMTNDVQALRSDAELGLADAVSRANDAMQRIAQINQQLSTSSANDGATANLLDERDRYIDLLAQLMDIDVVQTDHNQVSVFTKSGIQLVGIGASTLAFDAQGTITPVAQWSADPTERAVGTIVLKSANGGDFDLIANNSIRSGQIAAYLEMRDQILVEAQAQLDEIAAALARTLSDQTTDGTPVAGPQSGFDIDLNGMLDGNSFHLTYTDNVSNTQVTVTVVRVDDPTALPLPDTATSNPNDQVIGLDFSGGLPSIVAQLTAALGATGLQFSNPGGTTLRILDDGGPDLVDVDAVSATKTVTTLTGGTSEVPFFLDGTNPFTGAIRSVAGQSIGFAGRIAVNGALLADPSKLVVYQLSPLTPAGDATRPNFIYDRLNGGGIAFSPQSGIGTVMVPFSGSVHSFIRQVIGYQGEAAASAATLKEGQDVVFNALRDRFDDGAAVNIDQEMANLLNLQNAYAANARVLSTVKELLEILMRM